MVNKENNDKHKFIANNDPAFGLKNQGVEEKVTKAFRQRIGKDDFFNHNLIKGVYRGAHQVEVEGILGIPNKILERTDNTSDILSTYYGIDQVKGRNVELGGLSLGELLFVLRNIGYEITSRSNVQNPLRYMKNSKIGFSAQKGEDSDFKERMNALEESVQLQFFRSFYTPRFGSQEDRGYEAYDFFDEVYERQHWPDGSPKKTLQATEDYVHKVIKLLEHKQKEGDNFSTENFKGWLIKSRNNKGKVYFIQRKMIPLPSGEVIKYDCSCPQGYGKMHGLPRKGSSECIHIKSARQWDMEQMAFEMKPMK